MDLSELTQQVKEVIAYSQDLDIDEFEVDDILNEWYENKKRFIDRFGGLVYEYPVQFTFPMSIIEKRSRLNDFCDFVARYNEPLADFIYDMRPYFYDNMTNKEYIGYNGACVPAHSKIVKAFKYFETNKDRLVDFQNRASMLIQEDKICGTLCLSVHPLDFLSSSENTYNWRSCHALDGDYRAGNLSYMTDEVTCICYLKGMGSAVLPRFPSSVRWNSKKWRMLLHVDPDFSMIFAGRQYPFEVENALETLKQPILDALGLVHPFTPWHVYDKANNIVIYNNRTYHIDEIVTDSSNHLHYNDILYSTLYTPYYMYDTTSLNRSTLPHIAVGQNILCPRCHHHYVTEPSCMICDECAYEVYDLEPEDITYCSLCGQLLTGGDDMFWVKDDLICYDCYMDQATICEMCGESYYLKDMFYIDNGQSYLCPHCFTNYINDEGE